MLKVLLIIKINIEVKIQLLQDLLEYQDPEVKLFVACCAADVLRIYAPEAPYADEQLKVFTLICSRVSSIWLL